MDFQPYFSLCFARKVHSLPWSAMLFDIIYIIVITILVWYSIDEAKCQMYFYDDFVKTITIDTWFYNMKRI